MIPMAVSYTDSSEFEHVLTISDQYRASVADHRRSSKAPNFRRESIMEQPGRRGEAGSDIDTGITVN